jgi:hypothetical protein
MAGMLQHGDDFASAVDLDDLIVRREQIALLSVSEGGEEKEDKQVFHEKWDLIDRRMGTGE